ncbi:MAG: protein kinase [Polyangiaceae bacterium]|nr:protein kinase [Polyangiaceae bacterium]
MRAESVPDMLPCPACGARNLPEARYCMSCGMRLEPGDGPTRTSLAPGGGRHDGDDDEDAGVDPLIGVVVADRYRIVERIGRGGMGVVYKVEHARIGKLMALKLLAGELSRDRELLERFKREAQLASRLSHPNTVQVFDFGTTDGLTYLAMEYLRGIDLLHLVRREGQLAFARTAKIVIQACSSLAEAHGIGMVHRDVKPENIIILRGQAGDDVVKLLDFGLAKLRESKELSEVTTRGSIVGTPHYMSPEQIRGEEVDARSDIYSLGALLHTCLTGHPVFEAEAPVAILLAHISNPPVAPHVRFPALGLTPGVSAIVLKCLAKDPADRFQSVRDLQRALVEELKGEGQPSVELLLDSGRLQGLAGPDSEVATRDEVEAYERKLARRGKYAVAAVLVGLAAGAVAGVRLLRAATEERPFDGTEREPNDVASAAQPVPFGVKVRGHIGHRLAADRSDRDFYRIEVPAGTAHVRLSTTALPNFALCTLAYRQGHEEPFARYCAGAPARDLTVPRLELGPGSYLLAVLQDRDRYVGAEQHPVHENVSDTYELVLSADPAPTPHEAEPNDDARSAPDLAPGEARTGRLAWMGDVDVVCAAGPARFAVTESERPRHRHALLQARPVGTGAPVRIRRLAPAQRPGASEAASPWRSEPLGLAGQRVCLALSLVVDVSAAPPLPDVAPAGDEEYTVSVAP